MPIRLIVLAALMAAAFPGHALARSGADMPGLKHATPARVAADLPASLRHALIEAKGRRQFVTASVDLARAAAGRDEILTEADARGLRRDNPRAAQVRFYLKNPAVKRYARPRKLGSRSVPRLPLHKVKPIAGAIWDAFDANHDGILSEGEKAPLLAAR